MSKASNSRFAAGSGVFKCNCCGHNTRHTGGDGSFVKMCDTCYDLAGYFNQFQDGEFLESSYATVRGDFEWLRKNGRDMAKVQAEFPELWALTMSAPELTVEERLADALEPPVVTVAEKAAARLARRRAASARRRAARKAQ